MSRYRQRRVFKLGCDLLQKGGWLEAETTFRRALALDPHHAEAHHNLGIALLKLTRWEEAGVEFQRAVALNPTSLEPHANFGTALLKMGRFEEAVVACERALALHPQSTVLHDKLGLALSKLGRWEQAAAAYQQAIAADASNPAFHTSLGTAFVNLERWTDAAASFQQALSRNPDDATASDGLTAALARHSVPVEANVAPEITAVLDHLGVGMSFSKLERWEEAAGSLREGISGFQFLLVEPLMRLGRLDEAAAAYRQAVELGSSRPHLPGDDAAARFARRRDQFWTATNLGPEVFRTSHWLERAASGAIQPDPSVTDAVAPDSNPKLLFVLDNDYGELTTIMYLLLGRSLVRNTTLLLPPRLYPNNADVLPGRTRPYASLDDVVEAVDRDRPDIVFLCSGYLLSIHELFSLHDLQRLVGILRDRGCKVVTADPFLGLFATQEPRDLVSIAIPESSAEFDQDLLRRTKKYQDERLWTHFSQCAEIFRAAPHVYPAPDDAQDSTSPDSRSVAFFNSALTTAPIRRHEAGSVEDGTAKPHWLFLLSQTDYDTQVMFESHTGFTDIVVARLVDALVAGRHPIIIGPKEFIVTLADRMPTSEGVDLLYHCPFKQLIPILLNAEYAFYWNVLSHTILMRLFNTLPTVIFDTGHLVRNVPALYDRIVQRYYQGWTPNLADHRQSLTLAGVSSYAERYRQEATQISERLARAPAPEQLIRSLMMADATTAR